MTSLEAIIFCLVAICVSGQRIAPGVPPQQYANQHVPVHNAIPNQPVMHQQVPQQQIPQQVPQQQVPQQQIHQQQQQIPQQQQQIPQQQIPQQQVHQQQVLQQVPQQQVPVVQQQVPGQVPVQHVQHGVPMQQGHHGQQILNAANIAHEKEHIQEHMEVPIDTSKMSEQELQFHYFKMHDADNNDKLDGCELIKSLIHWHEQGNRDPNKPFSGEKVFTDEELVKLIDPILGMDDTNNDGFINYPEFVQAQQKAAGAAGRN